MDILQDSEAAVKTYQIRLMLKTKPGITSSQAIELGDSKTTTSCPGR
jgi:hypothetical protein